MEKEDGVWRTIRGRRVFIRKGESLGSGMAKSGKFKREDIRTAKTRTDRNFERYSKEQQRELRHEELQKALQNYKKAKYGYSLADEELKNEQKAKKELANYKEENKQKIADYKAKKQSNNKVETERELYERAKNNPDSIDPMTENSTDWEALEKKYGNIDDEIDDKRKMYEYLTQKGEYRYSKRLQNEAEKIKGEFNDLVKQKENNKQETIKNYVEKKQSNNGSYWNSNGKYQDFVNSIENKTDEQLYNEGIPKGLIKKYRDESYRYYRWFNDGDKPHKQTLSGKTYQTSYKSQKYISKDEKEYWDNIYASDMETRINDILKKMQDYKRRKDK